MNIISTWNRLQQILLKPFLQLLTIVLLFTVDGVYKDEVGGVSRASSGVSIKLKPGL